jgi:hypothetical protein
MAVILLAWQSGHFLGAAGREPLSLVTCVHAWRIEPMTSVVVALDSEAVAGITLGGE